MLKRSTLSIHAGRGKMNKIWTSIYLLTEVKLVSMHWASIMN